MKLREKNKKFKWAWLRPQGARTPLIQKDTTRPLYLACVQVSSRSHETSRSYALERVTNRQRDRHTDTTKIVVTAGTHEPKRRLRSGRFFNSGWVVHVGFLPRGREAMGSLPGREITKQPPHMLNERFTILFLVKRVKLQNEMQRNKLISILTSIRFQVAIAFRFVLWFKVRGFRPPMKSNSGISTMALKMLVWNYMQFRVECIDCDATPIDWQSLYHGEVLVILNEKLKGNPSPLV